MQKMKSKLKRLEKRLIAPPKVAPFWFFQGMTKIF